MSKVGSTAAQHSIPGHADHAVRYETIHIALNHLKLLKIVVCLYMHVCMLRSGVIGWPAMYAQT